LLLQNFKKTVFAIIPNMITVSNLLLGLVSIIFASDGKFKEAAVMILFSVILDGMDGKVARKLDVSSLFGKELDSLSDLVSFGVAPALLMYEQILQKDFGLWGLIAVLLFVTCGALRLARFNVLNISEYFVGIPITAAGGLMALVSLLAIQINSVVIILFMIFLAFLMVSNLKVRKYK
jgi:CDP-diacylglycerol--serine O-phosphatidyltransferase